MGGIGALLATGFEPAPLLTHLQEPIQQQGLRALIHQTHPKFGQQREVKAWISQFQPQAVFPINTLAHGIGGLAVREILPILQHRDHCQSPGRIGGLPFHWVEHLKLLVLIQFS